MKYLYISILGLITASSLLFSSCKKEGENIFNMFGDVEVTFHSNSPYSVTDYKEVSVGDSVYLEYTITSAKKGMYVICAYENGSGTPFIKTNVKESQRKSYSGVVKLKMTNKVGKSTYRIWALDSAGIYIGDGYKSVTVEVKSDFTYWADRDLFVSGIPDQTTGNFLPFVDKKSYYALATGDTYSYAEGAANSSKIDFGAALTVSTNTATPPVTTITTSIYALGANPITIPHYDISSWTKKGTLFSAPKSGQGTTFQGLRTGVQIVDAAKKAKPTLRVATPLVTGSLFYFLTTEGEYGAVYINSNRIVDNTPSMNIDVKIKR